MRRAKSEPNPRKQSAEQAEGRCVCGAVRLEIDAPAFWAWHDHSPASRHAQGCAYATYVGCWKSKVRIVAGAKQITRFKDEAEGTVRSFCKRCGTPLIYERGSSAKMINIPRALFAGRTGREPRYHIATAEQADWMYRGEKLVPLKGYPGVMWVRPRRAKKRDDGEAFF